MHIIITSAYWRKFLIVSLFMLLTQPYSEAFACDAPTQHFCVDFYKGAHLSGKPLVTTKAPYIKYNWKNRSPVPRIPYDNFSARWRGRFQFEDGPYAFRALADDGVRILVDGKAILDHWLDGAGTEFHTQFNPGAGSHLVEVEYFETTDNARLEVDWKQVVMPTITSPLVKSGSVEPVALNTTSSSNTTASASSAVNAGLAVKAAAPVSNTNKVPLGINLTSFAYYSAAVPFKDLIMQTGNVGVYKGSSNELCATQPPRDKEGYPTYLPEGCIFRIWSVFHIGGDYWPKGVLPFQSGRYVLLYKGSGKIVLGWDAKNVSQITNGRIEFDVPEPNNGLQIVITETDRQEPITDLHLVHADDEATYETQPFNEKWLSLLAPFQTIRFVDWGRINNIKIPYSSEALSHTSQTIQLPVTAPINDNAFDKMIAKINVNNVLPRVIVDSYEGVTRSLHLKTPIPLSTDGKQATVDILDYGQSNWSDRAQPTAFGQDEYKGVAFEYMIKLANTLNSNPWINIPTAADDDYVEQLAVLIKNNLKPGLKCHIEYSNETWNFGFPGYQYAEAKTRELGLTGTVVPADAWHAYRAVEIFKIFNRVFDEPDLHEARQQSRLVRVLTSQTASLNRAKAVMDWQITGKQWPTNGLPAYKYADAWAVTAYFGNEIMENEIKNSSVDQLMALQIQLINTLFGDARNPGLIRQIFKESDKRGLKLVGYEGGTHLTAPSGNPDLVTKLATVNQDERMKDVYLLLLKKWNELYQDYGKEKVGVLNHYADIFQYRKTGYWGLLQSTYQSVDTAPKYQAFTEFLK